MDWIQKNDCDVCAINETGLNGSEYVGMALHLHNEMVMKKICEGENKSGLYDHLNMLIRKGKEKNDSVQLFHSFITFHLVHLCLLIVIMYMPIQIWKS